MAKEAAWPMSDRFADVKDDPRYAEILIYTRKHERYWKEARKRRDEYAQVLQELERLGVVVAFLDAENHRQYRVVDGLNFAALTGGVPARVQGDARAIKEAQGG